MNAFDFAILSWLNRFVGRNPSFDGAVASLSYGSGFLKTAIILALCCWAWFRDGEGQEKNREAREILVSAMFACVISLVVARLFALALPFRVRPLVDPANDLHFPPSMVDWEKWSSFPSDHAVMFFALTTCLFSISKIAGWVALLDTTFVICLPRIYLGVHYPTDVLAGAALGIGVGLLATRKNIRSRIACGPLGWMRRSPGLFYAAAFLVLYQITGLFGDFRYVALVILRHLRLLLM